MSLPAAAGLFCQLRRATLDRTATGVASTPHSVAIQMSGVAATLSRKKQTVAQWRLVQTTAWNVVAVVAVTSELQRVDPRDCWQRDTGVE